MTAVASELESTDEPIESARRFYCGLLNGRQLTPERFLVRGVVVDTGLRYRGNTFRIMLRVDDPEGIAARCWNAGYTVVVDDARGAAIAVLDPFGLRIDLDRA